MTRHLESQLGIDLGTTHTVAALTAADGRSQPLLFDASFLLPSSVYADVDGHLLVGRDAERSARLDPSRFEPNPKRRIDDGTVLLGQREYAVSDLLAALLRRTADEASRVLGIMPVRTVLTYPANWATHRRSVLADAAARAGMPSPILVPEPIAAAAYFTSILGRTIVPGGVLVVYDFGGGTFDTTVLRRRPDGGWDVLASDGLPDVGGVDLDAAIIGHLGQSLTATDPDRWRQLTEPADDAGRRRHHLLREDVRSAKEQLSRASSASVHLPLFETDIHVTRSEFEQLSRPYLQRTVDLTASTLQRAGVRTDQIGGLFLVGGSSRIPMVSTLLHQRLGVAPTLIEQPELVVALGSVLAATPAGPAPFPPGAPPPGPRLPMTAPPMSGPPMSSQPMSSQPMSAPPSIPVSGLPAAPVSAPTPAPVSPAAFQSAATPQSPPVLPPGGPAGFGAPPPVPPPYRPVAPPRGGGGRTGLLVLIVVGVVLLLGVGGAVAYNVVSADKPDTGSTATGGGGRATGGGSAPTAGAKAGAPTQSVPVNKTIWYAQFKVTVNKVSYDAKGDNGSPRLSAEVVVENLGPDNERPYLPTVFNVGGQQFTGQFQESTTVAGGQKSTYTIDFAIYDPLKAGIATGELIFGEAEREQPRISLATGDVNAYEPVNLLKDKKVTVHDLTATFTSCDLRGGFFDYNGQAKKGYRVVMCKVDIQYGGTSSEYVGQEHFRLGAPDGSELGPDTAPNEAMTSGRKAIGTDLAFQVRADQPGSYKLRLVDLGDHKERQAGDVGEVELVLK